MAFKIPRVLLTVKRQGRKPAPCPQCGHAYVVLYVPSDVAKCQVCGRVWHPSDAFYRTLPGTDELRPPEEEAATKGEAFGDGAFAD